MVDPASVRDTFSQIANIYKESRKAKIEPSKMKRIDEFYAKKHIKPFSTKNDIYNLVSLALYQSETRADEVHATL